MVLASCAVGPDFRVPAAPEITRYTVEPLATQTTSTDALDGARQHFIEGRDIPQEWWALFKSPSLNALIERALKNNPTLQSAIATLRASKEAVYAQQGKFFPVVDANFNPTRQQTAASLMPIPASGATIYDLYTAQVSVAYTFDVWGANRRAVESLKALADTQRFEVEAAYLTLVANVAVAAITEASLREQIDATDKLIAINSKATLPPLRKALAQQRDLLAALVGAYTSEGPRETFKLADFTLPTDLPVSLPSVLIEQRPDVRAAEEQLHSASADIGVATANMLPNFTINGNAGYMNTALAGLLSPASAFWLIAGNAAQTVFDAGTLLHTLRGAQATYDAAAWTYRGTVVGAVQNVSDTLHALQNDADALRASRDFERAARISFDQARRQFDAGSANVLLLLTAQQTYLQAVIQLVQARAARLTDTAALFQALGGGWWNRVVPPTEKILDVSTGEVTTLVSDRQAP
jgi:outer membrane protein TolC